MRKSAHSLVSAATTPEGQSALGWASLATAAATAAPAIEAVGGLPPWVGVAVVLASCASNGAGIDPCGPWRPVLISRADTLTEDTARQILAHNEAGARLRHWR